MDAIDEGLGAIMRWARVRAFPRIAAEAGVEIDRSGMLIVFALHRFGPMRLSDLAASIGLDRSTISRQVAAVVRDGLVTKTGDASDARASQLALTARGDATRQKLNQAWRGMLRAFVEDWSPADQMRLGELLARLARAVDDDPTH